jgi:hypothetical protein
MKPATTERIALAAIKARKKRGPKIRIDPTLKNKLDTYDLHLRYGLTQAQIRELAAGDDPAIRGDWSSSGRWATTWDEIFRIEGWVQDGRPLTRLERRQAMVPPLTPAQYAKHPTKYGPEITADSVRKAIREGRQTGIFHLRSRVYLRAAAVVKIGV